MNDNIKRIQWKWFLFTIPFIVIGIYLYFLNSYSIIDDFDKAGKLGDSFGILNSLFSGLAFIALVITIYLQQQDMRDSKEETKKQNFENTFFKMLELYNNVVRDLNFKSIEKKADWLQEPEHFVKIGDVKINSDDIYYKGKEVIPQLLKKFLIYKKVVDDTSNKYTFKMGIYEDCHNEFENVIGHYFGTIYQILKYINSSNIDNKSDYINLFRAQFSKDELELLFYHATSKIAKRKFTPLLIKYEFFEHINIDKLDKRAIKKLIEKTEELNNELNEQYPLHKVFGQNEKSKEKVNDLVGHDTK